MTQMSCTIFVLTFGVAMVVFMLIASANYASIVSEINNSKSAGHKLQSGDRTKTLHAIRLHAKLFPVSRTRQRVVICGVLGILTLVVFVTSLIKCFGSLG